MDREKGASTGKKQRGRRRGRNRDGKAVVRKGRPNGARRKDNGEKKRSKRKSAFAK